MFGEGIRRTKSPVVIINKVITVGLVIVKLFRKTFSFFPSKLLQRQNIHQKFIYSFSVVI